MRTTSASQINPILKLVLEIGPLAAFFLTFNFGEEILDNPLMFSGLEMITGQAALEGKSGPLFVATASFMIAIAISLTVSYVLTRTLPRMALVTAAFVAVFGGLTLWLANDLFIKIKPTLVNCTFALILVIGLIRGRSYLKDLMHDAMPLTDEGWMIFTRRWAYFFLFLALVNEFAWRSLDDADWVTFKTFSGPALTFLFVGLHFPFLQRHTIE